METLAFILDWRQILNSTIGSIIAVLLVAPSTYYFLRWATRLANNHRHIVAVCVTLSGIILSAILIAPSLFTSYMAHRNESSILTSILSKARRYGGEEEDEPYPRVGFSCKGICNTDISSEAEICLDSKVQFNSERIGEYGSRNRSGLRTFIQCMHDEGYSAKLCQDDLASCVTVPDIGYRNPGSSVHYSAKCTTGTDGVICNYVGRYD